MLLLLAVYSILYALTQPSSFTVWLLKSDDNDRKHPRRSTHSRRFILTTMLITFFVSSLYLATQATNVVEFTKRWLVDSSDVAIDMVAPFINVVSVLANGMVSSACR